MTAHLQEISDALQHLENGPVGCPASETNQKRKKGIFMPATIDEAKRRRRISMAAVPWEVIDEHISPSRKITSADVAADARRVKEEMEKQQKYYFSDQSDEEESSIL